MLKPKIHVPSGSSLKKNQLVELFSQHGGSRINPFFIYWAPDKWHVEVTCACPPTESNHIERLVMWQSLLVLVVKRRAVWGQRVYFDFLHWNNIALCQDIYSNSLCDLSKTAKRSTEPILTSAKQTIDCQTDLFSLALRIWQETCCSISSKIQSHGHFQRKQFLLLFFFLEKPIWKKSKHPLESCQFVDHFCRYKAIFLVKFSLFSFPSDMHLFSLSKPQLPSPEPGSLGQEPQGFLWNSMGCFL